MSWSVVLGRIAGTEVRVHLTFFLLIAWIPFLALTVDGRTTPGRFFAFEHFDVVPDAAVLGKALGGGIVPIAAVVADATFNVAPELDVGHYTHEKNPLTTRAALTTLEIIADESLVARGAELGAYALGCIAQLPRRHPVVQGWPRAGAAA
ncbi:MAG: aminotransferase class III-fold pyridoxal phosphate-dependent enzyme, partial [Sphingomonadales bacterium]|nr:aminotransferase class III-fold pyridoxal phosphate-dependent enzyme [Sphingomonadales bacterium]